MKEMLFKAKFSWGTYIMISIFISSSLFAIFDRSIFATKGMNIFFKRSVFLYSLWFLSHRVLIPLAGSTLVVVYTPFQRRRILGLLGFFYFPSGAEAILNWLLRKKLLEALSLISFYFVAAFCHRNLQSLQERCSLSFSCYSPSHDFKPLSIRATDRRNKIQSQRQRFHKTHPVAQEDT